MNPIEIHDECIARRSAPESVPGPEPQDREPGPERSRSTAVTAESLVWFGERGSEGGRADLSGSGVGMAGLAERYWNELRPSATGRYQFDVCTRYDRERSRRPLGRPRRRARPRQLRTHRASR
jgi:hypothetical protein